MRLRVQLAIAFFLLAVVPLFGITVYTYLGSQKAIRRAVHAEAELLALEMSARVARVKDLLEARLASMRHRPLPGERGDDTGESAFEKARREALATAQDEELRLLLRAILSEGERQQGAIPFAVDARGRLYAPEPKDERTLAGLGIVSGARGPRVEAEDWVVAEQPRSASGIRIGVARPVDAALRDIRRTAVRNLGLGLALALVAGLGVLPLSHRMTRHIDSLTAGAERLARGELEVRVPVPHGREFARLAETFNRMARDLRVHQQQLVEQERLRKELEIGRRIQEELLPRAPLLAPFTEVSGVSIPAREVGGDFFNYFTLREHEVAILVGDVSGKGVGAALLMASLQATIRARLGAERDLACLVDALDREMESEEPLAPYYTLFLSVLETEHGRLRWVNAGHTTQFLGRTDGTVERLASTGRPPGLYPGGGYEQRTAQLRDGDALFLFTDGLVEAEDESGEPFGMARIEALLRLHLSQGLGPLLGRVQAGVREHRGPREAADDATMVALRYSHDALVGTRA
ncbi:MAG TPA: SpoIIE family protein phosphatase [Vicinamibacteria bacterium]|nr:SpoIIE family protein phosphatase [Vicinamibacteria bacterium]